MHFSFVGRVLLADGMGAGVLPCLFLPLFPTGESAKDVNIVKVQGHEYPALGTFLGYYLRNVPI